MENREDADKRMSTPDQLISVLDFESKKFSDESAKHKTLHRRSQLLLIVLTALSSVISGAALLFPRYATYIQFSVLVTTTLAAATTAWTEMRRARELWQHEREVYYALIDIKREIVFLASLHPLTEADVVHYFRQINQILGSSGQKWARIQEKRQS